MRKRLAQAFFAVTCLAVVACAECANDHRSDDHGSDKHGGIVVIDFNITGTTTLGSTELARLKGDFAGSCYNDDSEEMQERLRAWFQDRGYFTAEVKSLSFKPRDPLGTPKPVTVEAEVSEGPKYKVAEITFLENHAFSAERLREQFPLKKGDVCARGKVASGLEHLRKLYDSSGFLDFFSIPETEPSSNGTVALKVTVDEGPQYHMGKLAILAGKETEARLRARWEMAEGSTYDSTYIGKFVEENHSLLPEGFTAADVRQLINCPDAVVQVSLIVDPREGSSVPPSKTIPCESHHDPSK